MPLLVVDPGDAAAVNALLLTLRDIGREHIASLKAAVNLLVGPVPVREGTGVAAAHVPIAVAGGLCDQRGHAGRDADADARLPNTGGIYPMRLLKTLGGAAEFAQARQMLLQQGVRLP